jgi:hypothetical protein
LLKPKTLLSLLLLFLRKQTASDSGVNININGRHPGGFETDNAAAIGMSLFIRDIKMLTGKTDDVLSFLIVVISHVPCPGKPSLQKYAPEPAFLSGLYWLR